MNNDIEATSGFAFEAWITELNLPRKVSQILRQEELTSKETLSLLSENDLKGLGLPLGCTKVILEQVRKWKQGEISDTAGEQPNDKETQNEVTLDGSGKLLDELLTFPNITQLPSKERHSNVHNGSSFMDPRSILTMKANTKKTVHITQFLSENSKRRKNNKRKEFVLHSSERETIVFKTEDEHPYLGIQMEEWGAANMRVLNHLLTVNDIERSEVEFYLAYTTRIFEFAESFEWNSVLNYNYHYRELQAEHGFKWGTYSPHMELQMLVPKRPKPSVPVQNPAPKEDCRIFKAKGACPFGDKCRYKHVKALPSNNSRQDATKNQ
jgi:hypothetical protein